MSNNQEPQTSGYEQDVPQRFSRREALKKAGWTAPAIMGISLLNTATTMSGDNDHHGDGHHDGGHHGGGGHKDGGGHKGGGGHH